MFLAQCLEKCVCQCICLRCVCVEQRVYSPSYLRRRKAAPHPRLGRLLLNSIVLCLAEEGASYQRSLPSSAEERLLPAEVNHLGCSRLSASSAFGLRQFSRPGARWGPWRCPQRMCFSTRPHLRAPNASIMCCFQSERRTAWPFRTSRICFLN